MKIFCICLITLTFLYYVSADTHSVDGSHPDYPGKCFYDDTAFEPGEHEVRRRCQKITCNPNGRVSVHTCIKQTSAKSNCKTGDRFLFGKPFPECCLRKYDCVDENGDDYVDLDF